MISSTYGSRPLPGLLACLGAVLLGACGSDVVSLAGIADESDPRFTCLVPTSQIFDGGVGRDGIPALDFPEAVPVDAAAFMDDTMRVIGLEIDGEARAYPLFILWWHEIANDTLGGRRILMSYCPLTGSGLAFDPVVQGSPRSFGVSGLLFENNLIMFDRETESFWIQLMKGAVCGVERGTPLDPLPVVETTWGHWKALHPTTTVIAEETGFSRPYGTYPYGDYADPDNDFTLLPSSPWDRSRPPKELVLGVTVGQFAAAYPSGVLEEMGDVVAVNDLVASRPVLVTWVGPERTTRAFDRRVDDRELTFDVADAATVTFTDRETGSVWNARGEAVSGSLTGAQLTPVTEAWTIFWFSWSVFYPGTRIFEP